ASRENRTRISRPGVCRIAFVTNSLAISVTSSHSTSSPHETSRNSTNVRTRPGTVSAAKHVRPSPASGTSPIGPHPITPTAASPRPAPAMWHAPGNHLPVKGSAGEAIAASGLVVL
ncbi:hypothetical protein, partial [Actinomadura sp. KC216]|uniref:hypothetical protein n=1 Tax=Actinomadura sp. KC216 TaxID=2530370 RepID=UPI001A9F6D62